MEKDNKRPDQDPSAASFWSQIDQPPLSPTAAGPFPPIPPPPQTTQQPGSWATKEQHQQFQPENLKPTWANQPEVAPVVERKDDKEAASPAASAKLSTEKDKEKRRKLKRGFAEAQKAHEASQQASTSLMGQTGNFDLSSSDDDKTKDN